MKRKKGSELRTQKTLILKSWTTFPIKTPALEAKKAFKFRPLFLFSDSVFAVWNIQKLQKNFMNPRFQNLNLIVWKKKQKNNNKD